MMITKEQYSIFEKQFRQAVADGHISTFGDAAKYAMDWVYNAMSHENDRLREDLREAKRTNIILRLRIAGVKTFCENIIEAAKDNPDDWRLSKISEIAEIELENISKPLKNDNHTP